jgi:hypothetical protein
MGFALSLLGMSSQSAFPIMMGSCAFLMPVGSVRFIRSRCYSLRTTLGLGLAGVPAVLIAPCWSRPSSWNRCRSLPESPRDRLPNPSPQLNRWLRPICSLW